MRLHLSRARAEPELEATFQKMSELRVGALLIGIDPFFTTQSRVSRLRLKIRVAGIDQKRHRFSVGDKFT